MRTLQRGLAVYSFVLRHPGASFTEIRHATGLSKAVTHRMLAALERDGFVWRALSDGGYRARRLPEPVPAAQDGTDAQLAGASVAPLLELNAALAWPSDVFVFAGSHMRLQESSRRHSPFVINAEAVGREVDCLPTAVGRAWLGALAPAALAAALDGLHRCGEWQRQAALCADDPLEAIAAAGRNGYAFRDPAYLGQDGRDDRLQGLAVPIPSRTGPLGSVNLVWLRTAMSAETALATALAPLRRCAVRIGAACDAA